MSIAVDTETHEELKRQLAQAETDCERLTAEVERLRAAAQSAIDGYAKGDDVFGPMQKLRAAVQQLTPQAKDE